MGRRVLTRKMALLMWALLMFRPLADAKKVHVWKRSTAEIQVNGKVGEDVTLATGKATLDDYTNIVWLIIGNGRILSYAVKAKTPSEASGPQSLIGDPGSNNEQGAIIHQNQGERQSLTQGEEGQPGADEKAAEAKEGNNEAAETNTDGDNSSDAKENKTVESAVPKKPDAESDPAPPKPTIKVLQTALDTWKLTEEVLYKKEKIHFNPKNGDLTIGPLSLTDEGKYKVTMTPKSGKAEEKTFALKVTASAGRRCSHSLPLLVICSMSLMCLL